MPGRCTALFWTVTLTAGCFAHSSSTPLPLEPVAPIAEYDRAMVVGVREPEIKLDDRSDSSYDVTAYDSEAEYAFAISLIRSLREAGLYREVDFVHHLSAPPDFVLDTKRPPRLETCDPDAFLLMVYGLGVIPVWMTCDRGHYFAVEATGERFAFPWHETLLLGWIAPIFDLSPGWTIRPPSPIRRYDAFRAFLLSHREELLARQSKQDPPP